MTGGSPGYWYPAYVGIGSNLAAPRAQVLQAFDALGQLPHSRLVLRSGLYESKPLGPEAQPDFVNAVGAVVTTLDARDLLSELQQIEKAQGRVRPAERWGPRTLDLDLLVFGRIELDEADLTLPHPRIAERNFVLLPLAEIAPHLEIPGLGTVKTLASRRDGASPKIKKL